MDLTNSFKYRKSGLIGSRSGPKGVEIALRSGITGLLRCPGRTARLLLDNCNAIQYIGDGNTQATDL